MNITLKGDNKVILRADYPDESEDKIFMYRLSSACGTVNESSDDMYIAVANGEAVTLNNLPAGEYILTLL